MKYEDGRVMCCICFDGFNIDELYKDDNGDIWDMCQECGQREHKLGE